MRAVLTILITLVIFFVWRSLAYAYIDATSGGMLLQILLMGVAGFLVFVKIYWKSLMSRLFRKSANPSSDYSDRDPTQGRTNSLEQGNIDRRGK